mgnify:FL=1|tara:strand:+ start:241 stop:486 length:246 start_codon:yes stop_codon:yes gene_type:complete
MNTETQFEIDKKQTLMINGKKSSKAYYNLVVSIRDVKLWKAGIKAHRRFRLSDVKWYFGIKGNIDKLITQLEDYRDSMITN